jgi:DNA polymerase
MTLLDEIAEQVRVCTLCPLHVGRTNAVPGEGGETAKVMFVGEGPGADEDEQGRPFVGRAGALLRQMIDLVGLTDSEVFITNAVKCRPPGNRLPGVGEMDACKPYLTAQIAVIRPKLIVALGNVALQRLISKELTITKARGKHFKKSGQMYFATFHPAAILRQMSLKETLRQDFLRVKKLLEMDFGDG